MSISTSELEKSSLYNEVRAKRKRYHGEEVPSGITDYEVGWDIYGNTVDTYLEEAFSPMFSLEDWEAFLSSRQSLVALDFLASTQALASILSRFPKGRSLGLAISMEDYRTPQQISNDRSLVIESVVGDVSISSTWRQIEKRLRGRKADLIVERGAGGLEYIPAHRRFYGIVLEKAWKLLTPENGLMLIQTPKAADLLALDIDVHEWLDLLAANQISAAYQPYSPFFGGALKLVKTLDSPLQLPLSR